MFVLELVITIIMAVLGACAASFINAFSLRRALDVSNIKGRSNCPACEKTLHWYELIPIVSWLILLGKCSACKKPISPRYLITELVSAAAAALVFVRYGITLMTPLAFGVVVLLLAITLIDLSTMEIPNGLIIALMPFAIAAIWLQPEITLISRGIGFIAVSVPMFILAFLIGGFGGGDIKLMSVCGFLLGWQGILLAFFIGVITGGATAITKLLLKKVKKGDHIPFGPHLCLGIAISLLYAPQVIEFYLKLFP